ncbi:carboxymuconolactone decarboxylase family protein [Kitasatospora cathayae]|uniref:Carboxymuconolactone decarboxylase family protein n=1 Tax=Kitasatospora cathayae TaxID=3004092 RepID=A0ABY7QER4_9ACTN|nr:carboxymuconolactone decarboxylase family protein [Kitasatospora sp. HUAS 3-15]WBP91017.1 carboxymuconolactone decarboxylase family protein [Kitasatospora sp. HUAS 3-15]
MEARLDPFAGPVMGKVLRAPDRGEPDPAGVGPAAGVRELVKLRAGQVDGCGFRVDVHVEDAVHAGEDASRLNLVGAWREATVFTDAVREGGSDAMCAGGAAVGTLVFAGRRVHGWCRLGLTTVEPVNDLAWRGLEGRSSVSLSPSSRSWPLGSGPWAVAVAGGGVVCREL